MPCWPCWFGRQERWCGLSRAWAWLLWWRTIEYKCYVPAEKVDWNLLLSCPCHARRYLLHAFCTFYHSTVQIKPSRPSFLAKPGIRPIRVGPIALDFFPVQIMPPPQKKKNIPSAKLDKTTIIQGRSSSLWFLRSITAPPPRRYPPSKLGKLPIRGRPSSLWLLFGKKAHLQPLETLWTTPALATAWANAASFDAENKRRRHKIMFMFVISHIKYGFRLVVWPGSAFTTVLGSIPTLKR